MLPKVFISYRRGDANHAQKLRDVIAERSASVFLDQAEIVGGDVFPQKIRAEILDCDVFLMLIGPSWLRDATRLNEADDWVRTEFELARPAVGSGRRRIPICVGVEKTDALAKVPAHMSELSEIDFEQLDTDIVATMRRVGVLYPVKLPDRLPVEALGRDEEWKWLDEQLLLRRDGRAIINLCGQPGIGKSHLATEYAFRSGAMQRYTGGLCWIDAKGKSADDEIVDFFGAHLGFEPSGKQHDRVANGWLRWSNACPGRKLVIIDNVESAEQIQGLMPHNNAAFDILVTSRQPLELPDSKSLQIRPVSEMYAFRMLKAYAEKAGHRLPDLQDPDTKELCRIAGGLPLAIKLLGDYLKRYADDLSVLVHELQKRGIEAVIDNNEGQLAILVDAVWEGLNTEGVTLASILSLFNAPPYTWTLAGGVRRNDRSDAARRISARDIDSFHEGLNTPIHSVLQHHFVEKLASGARETLGVWRVLADHFVFQQFIYDSQYLANALDQIRSVRQRLDGSDTTAQLVLDKLVAHACYNSRERAVVLEALDCFSRLLAEAVPQGIQRWYAIFAADHAQNLLVTRLLKKETERVEGFAFTSDQLTRLVHRLLPSELLDTKEAPRPESFPFLLRAAHFWGHQGNQRSYQLYKGLEALAPADFELREREGRDFYSRAALFRLQSLRFSSARAFERHVSPLLKEFEVPDWLVSPVEELRQWEFSVERFNSDAQGVGDAAHQIRGLGDVQIWAYLYWERSKQSGGEVPHPSPNERLAEAKRTLELARKLWDVAKNTARQGEKPIQYYLWLADLEEKVALAWAHSQGRPIEDWQTVQQRVADRQAELESQFGLRYEWAREKSIEQLKEFHRLILALVP